MRKPQQWTYTLQKNIENNFSGQNFEPPTASLLRTVQTLCAMYSPSYTITGMNYDCYYAARVEYELHYCPCCDKC